MPQPVASDGLTMEEKLKKWKALRARGKENPNGMLSRTPGRASCAPRKPKVGLRIDTSSNNEQRGRNVTGDPRTTKARGRPLNAGTGTLGVNPPPRPPTPRVRLEPGSPGYNTWAGTLRMRSASPAAGTRVSPSPGAPTARPSHSTERSDPPYPPPKASLRKRNPTPCVRPHENQAPSPSAAAERRRTVPPCSSMDSKRSAGRPLKHPTLRPHAPLQVQAQGQQNNGQPPPPLPVVPQRRQPQLPDNHKIPPRNKRAGCASLTWGCKSPTTGALSLRTKESGTGARVQACAGARLASGEGGKAEAPTGAGEAVAAVAVAAVRGLSQGLANHDQQCCQNMFFPEADDGLAKSGLVAVTVGAPAPAPAPAAATAAAGTCGGSAMLLGNEDEVNEPNDGSSDSVFDNRQPLLEEGLETGLGDGAPGFAVGGCSPIAPECYDSAMAPGAGGLEPSSSLVVVSTDQDTISTAQSEAICCDEAWGNQPYLALPLPPPLLTGGGSERTLTWKQPQPGTSPLDYSGTGGTGREVLVQVSMSEEQRHSRARACQSDEGIPCAKTMQSISTGAEDGAGGLLFTGGGVGVEEGQAGPVALPSSSATMAAFREAPANGSSSGLGAGAGAGAGLGVGVGPLPMAATVPGERVVLPMLGEEGVVLQGGPAAIGWGVPVDLRLSNHRISGGGRLVQGGREGEGEEGEIRVEQLEVGHEGAGGRKAALVQGRTFGSGDAGSDYEGRGAEDKEARGNGGKGVEEAEAGSGSLSVAPGHAVYGTDEAEEDRGGENGDDDEIQVEEDHGSESSDEGCCRVFGEESFDNVHVGEGEREEGNAEDNKEKEGEGKGGGEGGGEGSERREFDFPSPEGGRGIIVLDEDLISGSCSSGRAEKGMSSSRRRSFVRPRVGLPRLPTPEQPTPPEHEDHPRVRVRVGVRVGVGSPAVHASPTPPPSPPQPKQAETLEMGTQVGGGRVLTEEEASSSYRFEEMRERLQMCVQELQMAVFSEELTKQKAEQELTYLRTAMAAKEQEHKEELTKLHWEHADEIAQMEMESENTGDEMVRMATQLKERNQELAEQLRKVEKSESWWRKIAEETLSNCQCNRMGKDAPHS